MGKKRTSNQQLEKESRTALEAALSEWVINDLHDDFGLDFVVHLAKPAEENHREVTAHSCFIQLKASREFEGEETIRKQFETDFLESYHYSRVPILIVFYEQSTGELYWTCLQEYIWNELLQTSPEWWSQDSVQINISRNDRIENIDDLGVTLSELSFQINLRQAKITQLDRRFNDPANNRVHHLTQYQRGLVLAAEQEDSEYARKSYLEKLKGSIKATNTHDGYDATEPGLSPYAYYFRLHDTCQMAKFCSEEEWESLYDFFVEKTDSIASTIYNRLVGNVYMDCELGREFTIVDLTKLGRDARKPMWMAEVQYENGKFYDESAIALAQRLDYQLIEYNLIEEGVWIGNSCGEENHDFEVITVDSSYRERRAICSSCGLSVEVLAELAVEDTPAFCEECGALDYGYQTHVDQIFCQECAEKI